jgi:surfactin synthase thioesterase subunit
VIASPFACSHPVGARRRPHRDESVHLRDDDGIIAEVRRLNGTTSSVLSDDALMRAVLPALRADYQAAETYRCAPGVTISSPATVLTGDSDPKTTLAEANAWADHTTNTCITHTYSGGHFFLTAHTTEINGLLKDHFQKQHPRFASSRVTGADVFGRAWP